VSTSAAIEAAERLAPLAAESAEEGERQRRLPAALADALRASPLPRLGLRADAGGSPSTPGDALRAAEIVARADASAGWCVSIAATSSLLSGYLSHDGASEVFAAPDAVAAGVWAPRGRAVLVDDGLRVSGQWSFCSGITHSDWLFAGCFLDGADPPQMRVVALPVASLSIEDTWHTSGLRATGSHDAVADDVLVPASHVCALFDGPAVGDPLYRFPIFGFFAASIAAAALGNASGAVDDLIALAGHRTPMGSRRAMAERAAVQARVAEAEAALRAARSYFHGTVAAAWQAAQDPDAPVATSLRLDLRMAATHAVRTAADVASTMYDLGGGTAIYERSPLQRRFRDAHTATAHFQVAPGTWELAGRLLLNQPTDTTQL
jgi:alkylation response protein AidB-like acyl-CoA dehydrogenase